MYRAICWLVLLYTGMVFPGKGLYGQQIGTPLTETKAVNDLPEEEAGKGVAVRLEGMIMHCSEYDVTYCMLRDHTGAISIKSPNIVLEPGMIVDVSGRTIYEREPVIEEGAVINVIRKEVLPEPLRTVEQVRSLSLEDSELAYPIHLEGVITYCTSPDKLDRYCFLQDNTSGIFVLHDGALPKHGSLVEIRGLSTRGWFAPDIRRGTSLVVKGEAPLPAPLINQ